MAGTIYKFSNPETQKEYEALRDNPDRLDLSGELGIAKLCMTAIVKKLGAVNLEQLSPDAIATFMAMVKQITETTDTIARIEKTLEKVVTIEQFMIVIERYALMAAKYMPEEVHEAFFEEVRKLPFPAMVKGSRRATSRMLVKKAWEGLEEAPEESESEDEKTGAEPMES